MSRPCASRGVERGRRSSATERPNPTYRRGAAAHSNGPAPSPRTPGAVFSAERKLLSDKQAEISFLEKQKGTLPSEVEAAKVKEEAVAHQLQQTKAGEQRRRGGGGG